jgi:hypothetical protein
MSKATSLTITSESTSPSSVAIEFAIEPVTVIFGDNLTSVKFMRNGEPIDPRLVLSGLATGELVVTFEQEWNDPRDWHIVRHVVSQTWRVVPKG